MKLRGLFVVERRAVASAPERNTTTPLRWQIEAGQCRRAVGAVVLRAGGAAVRSALVSFLAFAGLVLAFAGLVSRLRHRWRAPTTRLPSRLLARANHHRPVANRQTNEQDRCHRGRRYLRAPPRGSRARRRWVISREQTRVNSHKRRRAAGDSDPRADGSPLGCTAGGVRASLSRRTRYHRAISTQGEVAIDFNQAPTRARSERISLPTPNLADLAPRETNAPF